MEKTFARWIKDCRLTFFFSSLNESKYGVTLGNKNNFYDIFISWFISFFFVAFYDIIT